MKDQGRLVMPKRKDSFCWPTHRKLLVNGIEAGGIISKGGVFRIALKLKNEKPRRLSDWMWGVFLGEFKSLQEAIDVLPHIVKRVGRYLYGTRSDYAVVVGE